LKGSLAACLLAVATVALPPASAAPADTNASSGLTITGKGTGTYQGGTATIVDDVELQSDDINLFSDRLEYVLKSRDATATGNVRLYRPDGTYLRGNELTYNLDTRAITGDTARLGSYPVFAEAVDITTAPDSDGTRYDANGGLFTTENLENPAFKIRPSSLTYDPEADLYTLRNPVLYAGDVPLFWLPYLVYQPGRNDIGLQFNPGYRSEWGPYLLTAYAMRVADPVTLKLHLDLRYFRGVAYGPEAKWVYGRRRGLSDRGELGQGTGGFYIAHDQDPAGSGTAPAGQTSTRYRITTRQRLHLDAAQRWSLDADVSKLSDSRLNRDFFEGEFQLERQPDNYAALAYQGESVAATLLGRYQLNSFFETVERLPEFTLEVKRVNVIPGFSLEYNGETAIGALAKKEGEEGVPGTRDLAYTRFDTHHSLSLPMRAGWLNVLPHVGWRGTYYSQSLGEDDELPALNDDPSLQNTSTAEAFDNDVELRNEPTTFSGSGSGGAVFRSVFDAGLDLSFKLSRTWNVQNEAAGIDGFRHVVEPWLKFSYVSNPNVSPDRILPIDARLGSTRLQPLDFPVYNSVDSIDNQAVARVGVRQRWQTKRDKRNYGIMSFNSWLDVDIERQYYRDKPTSNFFNELEFQPMQWLRLRAYASTDLYGGGYDEYNTRLSWQFARPVRMDLGTRYIHGSEFFRDNNEVSLGWMLRLNESWSASTRHVYDVTDSQLRVQNYTLYRDLTAWRVSLNAEHRRNTGGPDETIFFVGFTLKAFPERDLPVGYTPGTTAPITVGGR
jgi:lipopolysaccharide assembly outer membrane protein LptD (OstA)